MTWADEYLTMIGDCEKRESKCSDWERGFLDSLQAQILQGKMLSPKQAEKLDNIWERVTK